MHIKQSQVLFLALEICVSNIYIQFKDFKVKTNIAILVYSIRTFL